MQVNYINRGDRSIGPSKVRANCRDKTIDLGLRDPSREVNAVLARQDLEWPNLELQALSARRRIVGGDLWGGCLLRCGWAAER